jgi:uncharacterized membrane protein YsdA (DUF1294 family)
MASVALVAAAYAVTMNLLAFALFGIDKRRAITGDWRIRESTLIGVALAGGWLGAKAGQRRFSHKTRKQPFARQPNAVGLLQLGVLAVLAGVAMTPSAEVAAAIGWGAEAFERIVSIPAGVEGETTTEPVRSMPTRFGPGSGDGM